MKTWKYISVLALIGAVCFRTASAQDTTTTTTTVPGDTTTTTVPGNTSTTVVQTEPAPSTVVVSNYSEPYYRDHELSIDGFGTLSLGEQFINNISATRVHRNGRLGAGAGVNLFFAKNVGIGADAWSEDVSGRFIDNVSGNLIVRFPIADTGLAPYVFGGGGYQFEPVSQAFGQFGAGVEIRFNPHAGIFVDARYLVTRRTDDFGLGRAGLRFSF